MSAMEERSSKFDNIKTILIFLVVLCHFFELFDGNIRYRIYMFVYTFHMPVFVFVSGYFAKFKIKNIVYKQLYTYLVFQIVFCSIYAEHTQYVMPYWHLWYLFCLMFWTMTIPVIKKYTPLWIITGFVVSLIFGYVNLQTESFSLYRLVSYLPFFIAGYFCGSNKYFLKNTWYTYLTGGVLTVFCSYFTYNLIFRVDTNWLFRSLSYSVSECGIVNMVEITFCSVLWCISFMTLIPDKRIPVLTDIGKYSICVFLLHGFVQRTMFKWCNIFVYDEGINLIIAFGLTFFFVCCLSGNKYMFKFLKPFTDFEYLISKINLIKNKAKNI